MLEKIKKDTFVTILASDATFRLVVPLGTPDSVEREYETSDGQTGKKNELIFNKLTGKITKVEFIDGDYGELIQLTFTDSAGELVLSVPTDKNFGEDIMKKLPNIELSKDVAFSPFSFEDDKGKTKKGVSIVQDEKKIQNFFYDPTLKTNINGYPNVEGSTDDYKSDDWKIYFMQARKFLVSYIKDNIKI